MWPFARVGENFEQFVDGKIRWHQTSIAVYHVGYRLKKKQENISAQPIKAGIRGSLDKFSESALLWNFLQQNLLHHIDKSFFSMYAFYHPLTPTDSDVTPDFFRHVKNMPSINPRASSTLLNILSRNCFMINFSRIRWHTAKSNELSGLVNISLLFLVKNVSTAESMGTPASSTNP